MLKQKIKGHQIGRFSEHGIFWAVAIADVIVSIVLLIGAMVSLFIVTSPTARISMVCGFTALFAVCVGILTKARRHEVFAASAAYAAVLVVFVSGELGGIR
jgi:hypothetical protein